MKNYIASSAIIGRVKLGKNIYIGNNSVIGTQPQYVGFSKNKILSSKFKDLIIADNVVIMDLCHIHAGIKRNTKIIFFPNSLWKFQSHILKVANK